MPTCFLITRLSGGLWTLFHFNSSALRLVFFSVPPKKRPRVNEPRIPVTKRFTFPKVGVNLADVYMVDLGVTLSLNGVRCSLLCRADYCISPHEVKTRSRFEMNVEFSYQSVACVRVSWSDDGFKQSSQFSFRKLFWISLSMYLILKVTYQTIIKKKKDLYASRFPSHNMSF